MDGAGHSFTASAGKVNSFLHIFRGQVMQGKIVFDEGDVERMAQAVKGLEGKRIEVKLGKERKKRSVSQNAWYWGCIIPMIQEAAGLDTAEETHEALKIHFLSINTGKLQTVRSTADLSTDEMAEYCEACRRLGATMFGIDIPDPSRAGPMRYSNG